VIALDTNCVLRFLLGDVPHQSNTVIALLQRLQADKQQVYLVIPVLLEVTWVLKRRRTKQEIIDALDGLLTTSVFVIEHHAAVREALEHWRLSSAGFADHLIGAVARSAGCSTGASFDKDLQKSDQFFRMPEHAA
jgi:predicted nucleic-acid-binding protein